MRRLAAGVVWAVVFSPPIRADAPAAGGMPAFYAQAQAERGAELYQDNCASCHGEHLNDGAFARALMGAGFRRDWVGKTLGALGQFMLSKMPPGKAGQLTIAQYTDVLAFLISANGVKAGDQELPADPAVWEKLTPPP